MTVASNIVHKNCQFELPFANFCPESDNCQLTFANLGFKIANFLKMKFQQTNSSLKLPVTP